MEIIHAPLEPSDPGGPILRLAVDRLTLARRRWRGEAEDGKAFGFDLERPLRDGELFFATPAGAYAIAQKYEPVLELALGSARLTDLAAAARAGWLIGNLHFPIEVTAEVVRIPDDPAVRQMLAREGFAYCACKRVFRPLAGGHSHGPSA